MKLKYLGTAAAEGWPGLFCTCENCKKAKELGGKNIRTRSQAILDDSLLIDFPPDSYMHMLRDNVDLPNIRNIIITHTHADHLYLHDLTLRCEWFAKDIQGLLTIYGNDKLITKYNEAVCTERQIKMLEGKLEAREIEPFKPVKIGKHIVEPMLANHDKTERCYIYLIESEGKTLLYGNDTGYFLEETWKYLQGRHIDLVSLDCTSLAYKEGTNHMGIPDVLDVRKRLLEMKTASDSTLFIVTHFSHNGELLHHEIEERVGEYFTVAYDGMEIEI